MTVETAPAVVSTALRPVLDGPERPATVLGVTGAAAYLGLPDDGGVVALVAGDAVRLPNALVVDRRVVSALAARPVTSAGGGRVRVGTFSVVPSRWWDPRPRLGRVHDLAGPLGVLEGVLPPWAPGDAPFAEALRQRAAELAAALRDGDPGRAAAAAVVLVGLGPGLTPAGDDVVAGALAALRLLGAAAGGGRSTRALADGLGAVALAAAGRTGALSATLLRHADRGEVAAPAAGLLLALAGRRHVRDEARVLLGVGHTSGHDLARGILAGGRAVAARHAEVAA